MRTHRQSWKGTLLRSLLLIASALPLASCVSSGTSGSPPSAAVALPEAPELYRRCFADVTALPPVRQLSPAELKRLTLTLRTSELSMSRCGLDLIRYHDRTVTAINKGHR